MVYIKPSLNIRHIEAFRAVMLAGSVVGAAKLLNVTQPGVSRTIALLELRLGYSLFERRGRRLIPTAEAEALYREIEQVYVGIERIGQIAEDIRFHRAGAVRISTLPALAQWLVPRATARFLEGRPKVSLLIQSLPSRQIADLVSTRQFDIGIVELPLSRPGVQIRALPPAPTMAVVPATHRLATSKAVSLKDLDGERMVLLSQHSYVRYEIDDAFSKLGVAPHVIVETPNSTIACGLAAAGVGITLVSGWTAKAFASAAIAVLPVREPLASRYAAIFPHGREPVPLAKAFAEELESAMRPDARHT